MQIIFIRSLLIEPVRNWNWVIDASINFDFTSNWTCKELKPLTSLIYRSQLRTF